MRKGPTASELIERRRQPNFRLVEIPHEKIEEEYIRKYIGGKRIHFASDTITKPRPDDRATLFYLCTRNYISKHELKFSLENSFFEECIISHIKHGDIFFLKLFHIFPKYPNNHYFSIKLPYPIQWNEFIFRVVTALEDRL